MNARLARNKNHCQTYGIHMFTKQMKPNLKQSNQLINARWARRENQCQTQGFHMFTKQMLAKPYEKQ